MEVDKSWRSCFGFAFTLKFYVPFLLYNPQNSNASYLAQFFALFGGPSNVINII